MNEDELMTTGFDAVEDDFFPSGWKEGDDFFADPSTWSGNGGAPDEGAEVTGGAEPTTPDAESDAAPTTSEADDDGGRSAEEAVDNQTPGQADEATKNSRTLKLKVNHEDREVDINSMPDEELIERLQKSYAFDAMKERQDKEKYRELYQEQLDNGMTEEVARLIASNAFDGKTYSLEDPAPETDEGDTADRDFESEVRQLKALYPDFKETPDEVALAVASGTNLLTAYVAYREKQTQKAAASLKKENEVLKHNAASAAKAPVKGVTGGGATDTKPKSDLLAGFDSDSW